jgi:hypothetical protein
MWIKINESVLCFQFELPQAYCTLHENGEVSPKYRTIANYYLVLDNDVYRAVWTALPTVVVDLEPAPGLCTSSFAFRVPTAVYRRKQPAYCMQHHVPTCITDLTPVQLQILPPSYSSASYAPPSYSSASYAPPSLGRNISRRIVIVAIATTWLLILLMICCHPLLRQVQA